MTDYPIENGRRYHRYHEGGRWLSSARIDLYTLSNLSGLAYPYPNDEQELDRLDMQHHMFKFVMQGQLYHVPLKDPKEILDIGTGSGIWPIEMGKITYFRQSSRVLRA